MRVLFVAGACPYPPDSGGAVRTFNLLKRLCFRHEITLIAPSKPAVDLDAAFGGGLGRVIAVGSPARSIARTLSSLLSPLPCIVRAHENPEMRAAVKDVLASDRFDLLHCDSISVVPAIPADASVPKVYNAHNIEAVIWERYVREERRPWMIPVLRSQLAKVTAYEARLPRIFDWCFTVSENDRAEMRRCGFENVSVVPNGVDLDFYSVLPDRPAPTLAFIGSLDWRPNQDSVRWLLESIWPLIRAQMPDVSLSIVGRRPPRWIANLCRRANASLFADVPDVRPRLADASVIVVPLRIGGGSRLKILEAMAAGRCVVSTSIGAEGLEVRGGEHLIIADEPAAFAREAVSLLHDPIRRQALTRASRALVESEYDWERISLDLEAAWYSMIGPSNLEPRTSNIEWREPA